jgi:Predicted dehydrogenases and related proteins
MVTARHGGDHLRMAEKFIEAKIPAFIDKPFTVTPDDAVKLRELARKNGVPICGGSCCGFVEDAEIAAEIWKQNGAKKDGHRPSGVIHSPVSMVNDYGNFFFYSQHLVQIMCEIFGYYPEAVSLKSRGETADGYVKYADFHVDVRYTTDYTYKVEIAASDGATFERVIDINKDGYSREVDTFCDMVRTGKMHRDYDALSAPVFILNAMQKSMDADGAEVKCVFE